MQIDSISLTILRALEENARITYLDIGRKVGLSGPAVTDRIRRMEETGIITGYHAVVNPAKIGFFVRAFLRVKARREHYAEVIALARTLVQVRECHHVAGEDSFFLRVVAVSREDLDSVVSQFSTFGETNASVVDSTPVEKHST